MIDVCFGVFVYVAIAMVYGHNFQYQELAWGIVFTLGPDLDFIPFVFLRKRWGLVSHQFIHYPLLYLSLGTCSAGYYGGAFLASMFFLGGVVHFLHDTMSPTGIYWWWPIGKTAYTIKGFHLLPVQETWRECFYNSLRKDAPRRGIFDEVFLRISDELSVRTIFLTILAATALLFFVYRGS